MTTPIEQFQTYTLTINRPQNDGEYVNGWWVEPVVDTFDVKANIQPLRGQELENLPEAQRTKKAIRVYVETKLQTASESDAQRADRFELLGHTYEIWQVEDWFNTDLPHYKCIATQVDAFEEERIEDGN